MAAHAYTPSPNLPPPTVITRRAIAAATAILAVSVAAAGAAETSRRREVLSEPTSPDATLIALCAEFCALERRRQAACNAGTTIEEDDAADLIYRDVHELQQPILDQICAAPATTTEGMAALAAALTLWDREIYYEEDDPNACMNERLQAALLRSVLAGRA